VKAAPGKRSKPRTGAAAVVPQKKKPRVRRAPEEAKQILLDACVELLIAHGPDGVGLKDVARKAGVSHALVTHYFGSIDLLIEAALERYAEQQRGVAIARIASGPELGPREWMKQFFDWGSRPETARMVAWSFLKGIITKEDFFSRRIRGAQRVVDAVLARFAAQPGAPAIPREDLEFLVMLTLAATHGYGLGREGYWPSLGKDSPGAAEDSFFFERLADIVELYAFRERKESE
jgi:TetR/AcrR family transcriptional regulator, repressor for neighboring sulfatase